MKRLWMAWWAMALVLGGCPSDKDRPSVPAKSQTSAPTEGQTSTSVVSAAHLGRQITVEGWARNDKGGAEVVGDDFEFWIDGLSIWPEGYYLGGDRGKRVRVTGILAEDHGLPVFIPKKGELPRQGIPVPEGTDLDKASHRYLLKDAKWELMEN